MRLLCGLIALAMGTACCHKIAGSCRCLHARSRSTWWQTTTHLISEYILYVTEADARLPAAGSMR